jgi:hypothetical protein
MKREIQAVADAHGITFDKAADAMCEGLQKAHGDKDVIFRYKNGNIKAMRKLDDHVLNAVMSEALTERVEQWEN